MLRNARGIVVRHISGERYAVALGQHCVGWLVILSADVLELSELSCFLRR
jgi:hypothetical protein